MYAKKIKDDERLKQLREELLMGYAADIFGINMTI